MIEHQAIVVGGGPAGATAAWELTRHGVDCLVLDREDFPRQKLCAGWITPDVLTDLEFQPADYPHRFMTYDVLHLAIKGLKFPLPSRQHSIRRFEFDHWLLERANTPVVKHNVRRIAQDNDHFVLDDEFRCRFLIGAGGTRCPVYRDLFRASQPRAKTAQIVTQELEFAYDWQDSRCHLWFLEHGLPGYAWYVPKANGYLNVGVGGFAHRLKQNQDDIKRHWQQLIDKLLAKGLIDAPPGDPGGYSYYLRPQVDITRLGNAFVAGDASGLATRDMGEGIGPAIRSGLLAARSIITDQPYELSSVEPRTRLISGFLRQPFRFLSSR